MPRLTVALAMVTLAACSTKPAETTPSGSPTATSSATPSVEPLEIPDDWGHYGNEEVGISFRFPAMGGSVYERLSGPAEGPGPTLTWSVTGEGRDSEGSPTPISITFAGSTSVDARPSQECMPTDAFTWREQGDGLLIDFAAPRDNCDHEIPTFESVIRDDGLEGVIFSADHFAEQTAPPDAELEPSDDLTAMLRYPDGFHPEFETIVFQLDEDFVGDITIADAELVLRSVRFVEPD